MKNKELIELLQKEDPELEVCVGNKDIYCVEKIEAYYDGCLQRLIIDESKKPYYSIVGGKIVSSGNKLKIHTLSIEDVIYNNPDIFIDLSDLQKNSKNSFKEWEERIENYRKEAREIKKEAEEMVKKILKDI